MHAGAVGALEVVEVDDGDQGGGVAADGTTGDIDIEGRILSDVEGVELGQGLVVVGDEEVDDGFLLAAGDGDGQGLIAGNLAGRAGAEGDVEVFGDVELGADHDLNAAVERGIVRRRSGLGLASCS
jgi:hypothetical protein